MFCSLPLTAPGDSDQEITRCCCFCRSAVAVFGRNDVKNQRVLSELKVVGVPSIAVMVS